MTTAHQTAALARQAQALAHAAAQQYPLGAHVAVMFKLDQQQPTPAVATGHKVEVEATSEGAVVRVFVRVEYEQKRRGVGGSRFVDIARVQLQHPDGSDHTTA